MNNFSNYFSNYFQNYQKISFFTLSFMALGFGICYYRNISHRITFGSIDKNYKKKLQWEEELDIYEISMPRFFINGPKKSRCLLLIGGYKDIPYVWDYIEKLFISDGFDFYAPRTHGNGRSFFQDSNWKDWVITYLEAIYVLENQYESIDIIGFSTGSVIALYLAQFKYKCKINNIFLCAPFLIYKPCLSIKLFFSPNIFSYLLNRLCVWTIRFHPKSKTKYAGFRDTNNPSNSISDYCENFGDLQTETSLFDFINFRPKCINASNVIILYPNDDDVIGNIYEQHKIVSETFHKSIDLITIPSYVSNKNINNLDNFNNLPMKCGHVMFKEYPEIIFDLYLNIKKYLVNS
jgi:pimeloyl-ACP methyl ester carboxylesterase